MPARVCATDRIRSEIDPLFDGLRERGEVIEDITRLGPRLIIQTAVEAEAEVFLGRARYQRAAGAAEARPTWGPPKVRRLEDAHCRVMPG